MKTAICVIIKDENDYLDEWLDYHLNLGIDEIYLYEDYGSLSHSTITGKYGDRVHLNSIDILFNSDDPSKNVINTGEQTQIQLFNYFSKFYRNKFDWILFIDLDEFLILKQPLHQLLEEYDDKPGVLLKWRWYGASGHINKPIGKVMDNYTKQITTTFDWGWHFKSFLNCKKFEKWEKAIHKIQGAVFPLDDIGCHKAYLNHYFTKSWEEWKFKLLSRGDNFPGNRKIEHFFHLNKDMLPLKNDLLLDIAIENATKMGFNKNKEKGIKYLHFCWFGGNSFNEMNKLCIESWKKYLSDEFIVCLWNESSFGISDYQFTNDAYKCKYWAFVVDYVRLWAIYNFGGVYLDTDVELLKPINNLPKNFLAIEKGYNSLAMGLGFGAEKRNNVIGDLLTIYNSLIFDKNNLLNLSIPKITTDYFISKEYEINIEQIHNFLDFTIFPSVYFCPKNHQTKEIDVREETISIHHYHESWVK